jgi:hypothetical protein
VSRQFSVIRRTPNLVDVLTPFVYGTVEYRLKWSSTFDGVFTTLVAPSAIGYLDPTVNQAALQVVPNQGRSVRIVVNPTNTAYSITNPNIPFWLKFARYDGSSETYVSPPTLLLPHDANHGVGVITIAGTAPLGASVANSAQIDLPGTVENLRFANEGGNPLFVAFEPGGPETKIVSGQDTLVTYRGTPSSILVRGAGGTTTFSATMTRAFPR